MRIMISCGEPSGDLYAGALVSEILRREPSADVFGFGGQRLAAAGIAGFRKMLSHVAEIAPLRRNVTPEDVGNAAAFLCSDLAAGITGEILHVDSGFNTVGMSFPAESEG